MPTYWDLESNKSAETWRKLRKRRAAAPASLPGGSVRAATFQSALEQSEQQFQAASLVGFDSRPLNLFYGLSQAGRAIAAASTATGNPDWKLVGHGITVNKSMSALSPVSDLPSMEVEPNGKPSSSYRRMSQILGSNEGPFTLGAIWPFMYETTMHAPLLEVETIPLHVHLDDWKDLSQQRHQATPDIPPSLKARPPANRPSLTDFLDRYPALAGWKIDGSPDWPAGDTALLLHWEATPAQQAAQEHVLKDRLTKYRGRKFAFPGVGTSPLPLHPLMAWWATLYTLSMLARYEPAKWTELIDIDNSQYANAIEYLLDAALDAVPELIDEALDEVS